MVSARQALAGVRSAVRKALIDSRSTNTAFTTVGAICALTVSGIVSSPAVAQQPQAGADQTTPPATQSSTTAAQPALEEVTVTGTRIKRKDLESTSPLVTIDSEQLESRAGLNLESMLNTLPQYNPAQTPTTENEDVQPSAVNTVGIATISLRGFGPNRSLVLIDGHRTTPVNALMVTDINTIPASMIDHVEIITGGASAVYGADAIGGVTNFILKKSFQGIQVDIQDGITQAGDGNELRVNTLMGTKIADGRGNMIMGMEYYNRNAAYQKNRDFFTDGWSDPNAPQTDSNALFVQNYNGYNTAIAASPSTAAMNTIFAARAAAGGNVFSYGSGGVLNTLFFNNNGSLWTQNGPLSTSNFTGATSGNGYGLANALDPTEANNSSSPPPDTVTELKWNNPLATVSSPQTRYSFFANGTYDITDNVQFYTNARYADSLTTTLLDTPTTGIFGWEAEVPFNAKTDSPINPNDVTALSTTAQLQAISAAFTANPNCASTTCNPYYNPNYIGPNAAGAQHPVPWQLALLLDSRGFAPGGVPPLSFLGPEFGGPITCQPQIAASECANAASSWMLWYLPNTASAASRSTVDTSQMFQIETGLRFPLNLSDWTGDLYYSRGQSQDYEDGYGSDSLERFRAVIDSPDYGAGQSFTGNQNGADAGFGTTVPSTCTSGYYNSIFGGANGSVSADCQNAVGSTLQTLTAIQQDIVEANFQGSVFKLPAGEMSAALGFQYRRDAGQFVPDNLQATNSFLDQTLGLYPLGTVNNEISVRDGYAELFVPLLADIPLVQKLDLDVGGRYSSYSNTPNATTFKLSPDWQVTKSFRVRGGYNRATRAPNLGELFLGEQEYFGGGAAFGDPCSLRSTAPFGAGGAAVDVSGSGTKTGSATSLASGQTAAGAESTYLICQALMGGTAATPTSAGSGAAGYYYGSTGNQSTDAAAAVFAWLNEEGNPNLKSETADTWTAGFVFSNLGENPWISGLSGSVDWWQVDIEHAIELDSPDYANFQCFGTVTVTTAAQAAAQAASAACQNVPRNPVTGGAETSLLVYTNQATIGTAGVDLQLNWFSQLSDLGLKAVPGAVFFNTQDTFLSYYKTKQSPASFDVDVNWKGSLGPTLAGTNAGAYSYRLTSSVAWVLPSVSVALRWRFLPSVNSAAHAEQQAIINNNESVLATGHGTLLSWIPNEDVAAPAYNVFDLSGIWTINKTFQLRAGINNLFNVWPAITGANTGYPTNTNLSSYCSAAATKLGCTNPSAYVLPNDGAGFTNPAFYDLYGRTFWIGLKASF